MGWMQLLSDFADGTLIDNTVNKIDEGLSRVEGTLANGIDKVDEVSAKAEQGIQRVADGADRAVKSTDGIIRKIGGPGQ